MYVHQEIERRKHQFFYKDREALRKALIEHFAEMNELVDHPDDRHVLYEDELPDPRSGRRVKQFGDQDIDLIIRRIDAGHTLTDGDYEWLKVNPGD